MKILNIENSIKYEIPDALCETIMAVASIYRMDTCLTESEEGITLAKGTMREKLQTVTTIIALYMNQLSIKLHKDKTLDTLMQKEFGLRTQALQDAVYEADENSLAQIYWKAIETLERLIAFDADHVAPVLTQKNIK